MSEVDITMPQLGETVAEGTVTRWLVEEGGAVTAEEPVLEVSTDKVDTEVIAPASGILRRIAVMEGETVPVGAVLAGIEVVTPGGPSSVPDTDLTEESPAAAQRHTPAAGGDHEQRRRPARHRDSPRVRRMAAEHGVDMDSLRRTGRHGRATIDDVLETASERSTTATAAAEPAHRAAPAPQEVSPVPSVRPASAAAASQPALRGRVQNLSRRRRVIAERMHRSLQETAQLTTVVEVDLTHIERVRGAVKDAFRQRYGVSLSVLSFVAEAAVQALGEYPVIHAELDLENSTVTYPAAVDLGIAVDTAEGLVVPVLRHADDLTVGGLARRIADVAARARDGSATADDYAGGTFTITNTGSRGALFDTPILNAPQAAILGVGAVVRRPVALVGVDGHELIGVRSMAYLSLTYDHRLVDGADAARYLTTLKANLEATGRSWASSVGVQEIK